MPEPGRRQPGRARLLAEEPQPTRAALPAEALRPWAQETQGPPHTGAAAEVTPRSLPDSSAHLATLGTLRALPSRCATGHVSPPGACPSLQDFSQPSQASAW